jgi:hypothetical protein
MLPGAGCSTGGGGSALTELKCMLGEDVVAGSNNGVRDPGLESRVRLHRDEIQMKDEELAENDEELAG